MLFRPPWRTYKDPYGEYILKFFYLSSIFWRGGSILAFLDPADIGSIFEPDPDPQQRIWNHRGTCWMRIRIQYGTLLFFETHFIVALSTGTLLVFETHFIVISLSSVHHIQLRRPSWGLVSGCDRRWRGRTFPSACSGPSKTSSTPVSARWEIVMFHFSLLKAAMNTPRLCKLRKDHLTGIG